MVGFYIGKIRSKSLIRELFWFKDNLIITFSFKSISKQINQPRSLTIILHLANVDYALKHYILPYCEKLERKNESQRAEIVSDGRFEIGGATGGSRSTDDDWPATEGLISVVTGGLS